MERFTFRVAILKSLSFSLFLAAALGLSACSNNNPLSSNSGVDPTFSASRSTLAVSASTVIDGGIVTIRLLPLNQSGGVFSETSLAVQFSFSGGTSSGTLSTPQLQSDGSYTATFSATTAGSAVRVSALVNGQAITGTVPIIQVFPSNLSLSLSTIQVASSSVSSGQSDTITLTTYDTTGSPITAGGAIVTFSVGGGSSTGSISSTTDNGDGTYSATFTGITSGSPTSIGATIDGGAVTSASPTIQVNPGTVSLVQSVVSVSSGSVVSGANDTLTLTAKDANGNQLSSGALIVTFATAGGTSSGSISPVIDNGNGTYTATFTGLGAGSATTITSTIGGSSVTSALPTVTVTAGPASKLAFTVQPTNTTSTGTINPVVQVSAEDANGNVISSFTNGITVAIGTNPGSGTLSGTATVAATSGVSSFSNLSIDKAGAGYTLTASTTGLTGATSSTFTIAVGPASKLVFTVQPTNTTSTNTINPAVQVSAEDAGGNVVPSFTGGITVAIGTNPSVGTLSGTATVVATSGASTFSNLSIDKAGTGYTLMASATGVTGTTSSTFNIGIGPVSQLAFTIEPTGATAATVISPAVQVSAEDAGGNLVTSFTGGITMAIGTNPGGGTLSGTATVAATSGVSIFSDLSINDSGTGYTLTASATGLTGATSSAFTISAGAVTQLAFTVQPTDTGSLSTVTPSVQVSAEDANGNVVTGYSGDITVAIGTNPSGGTLSGTLTITAFNGVSIFTDLSIDLLGSGYTLTASATGLAGATSSPFDVITGPAAQLVFTVQPSNSAGGVSIAPAIQVSAQDAGGNPVTSFTGDVTLAIGNNPSTGILSGTTTVMASSGVASFPGMSINTVGAGYTLTASASGLSGTESNGFNITLGSATQLVFTTQPSNALSTISISPVVQVSAEDAGGNVVPGYAGNITVAIGTNPSGGTLSGTHTVAASSGVSSFSNLSINDVGDGYTMTASAAGLTGTTSNTFDIALLQLAFTTQPSSTGIAGSVLNTSPDISIENAGGVLQAAATNTVTLAVYTNPTCATVATGTFNVAANPVTAISGVASFSGVEYTQVQTIYIGASAPGVVSACSTAINISPLPATQLAFITQPSFDVFTGMAFISQPVVELQDEYGNAETSGSNSVMLAAYTDSDCFTPAGGILSSTTNPLAATAGSATFTSLTYTGSAGTIYLGASASGLTSACSSAVHVLGNSPIAAGNEGVFVCANSNAGNVYCWGSNADGQLGNNTTTTEKEPVEVLGVGGSGDLSGINGITAGGAHACGVSAAGNAYCWGYDNDGQLGINSTVLQKEPVEVLGVGGSGNLSGIVSMASGQYFTCALSSTGNVYCWGLNSNGQLGINSTVLQKEPVEVLGVGGSGNLSGIVSIAGGAAYMCALSSTGNVYCWGYNGYGQLGNGVTTQEKEPVEVVGVGGNGHLPGIVSIAAGADHTCGVSSAGNVYCWGYNVDGQLGINSVTEQKEPVEVLGVSGSGNLSNIVNLAAGIDHTCGVSTLGSVYCWGDNAQGQLGINSTTNEKEPFEVFGVGGSGDLSNIMSIAGGKYSTCGVSFTGNVYCWGYNTSGQLGINSTVEQKEPVEVLGVSGVGNLSGI